MTCIVAVEAPDGVWVGSDSFLGNTTECDETAAPKWFRRGGALLAWAGDVRAAQVVEYAPQWRARRKTESADAYLVNVVVEAIRKAHRRVELSTPKAAPGTDFIVAYARRVWTVQEGYGLLRSRNGYAAIGAGSAVALGALAATAGQRTPEERVRGALTAAARHCPLVCAPFHVAVAR